MNTALNKLIILLLSGFFIFNCQENIRHSKIGYWIEDSPSFQAFVNIIVIDSSESGNYFGKLVMILKNESINEAYINEIIIDRRDFLWFDT